MEPPAEPCHVIPMWMQRIARLLQQGAPPRPHPVIVCCFMALHGSLFYRCPGVLSTICRVNAFPQRVYAPLPEFHTVHKRLCGLVFLQQPID